MEKNDNIWRGKFLSSQQKFVYSLSIFLWFPPKFCNSSTVSLVVSGVNFPSWSMVMYNPFESFSNSFYTSTQWYNAYVYICIYNPWLWNWESLWKQPTGAPIVGGQQLGSPPLGLGRLGVTFGFWIFFLFTPYFCQFQFQLHVAFHLSGPKFKPGLFHVHGPGPAMGQGKCLSIVHARCISIF